MNKSLRILRQASTFSIHPSLHSNQAKILPKRNEKKGNEWEMAVGKAIDLLRRDLPHLLNQGIPDTSVYSPDITFIEHHLNLHTRGLKSYLALVTLAKTGMSLFYENPTLEIVSMNQVRASDGDFSVNVRWIIEGTSRPALLASGLFATTHRTMQKQPIEKSVFEGVFVYRFDDFGLICEHVLQDVEPNPPAWFKSWSGFQKFRPAV
jgi:hypothetical protein